MSVRGDKTPEGRDDDGVPVVEFSWSTGRGDACPQARPRAIRRAWAQSQASSPPRRSRRAAMPWMFHGKWSAGVKERGGCEGAIACASKQVPASLSGHGFWKKKLGRIKLSGSQRMRKRMAVAERLGSVLATPAAATLSEDRDSRREGLSRAAEAGGAPC